MSDEGIELRSPFPIIPPVKRSKWGDLRKSPDEESQSLIPPKLYPDIGEPHPCPYFVGPDLNFIRPRKREAKPVPIPLPITPPLNLPVKKESSDDELFSRVCTEGFLSLCCHQIVWECVSDYGRECSREKFCALISSDPGKFLLDGYSLKVLMKKLDKKNPNEASWPEPCHSIDRKPLDVLICQAYKITKAKNTVECQPLADVHKKLVTEITAEKIASLFQQDMDKTMRKQDNKQMKQRPPRAIHR